MNNNHTPGFYILEEERCRREYENIRKFANINPTFANDYANIMLDRINILQNRPETELYQSQLAEISAYKQLQHNKKTTLLQKLKELIK